LLGFSSLKAPSLADLNTAFGDTC